jgi:hypothetical protein
VVGEHADLLELVAAEQVGLVEDQYHGADPFGFLGDQQVAGLQDQVGLVEAGVPPSVRTMWA